MLAMAQGDIGRRMKAVLDQRKVKYRPADLARALDVSPQRLNNWLTGDNDPPAGMLGDIARELETTINRLLGEPDLPMEVSATSSLAAVGQKALPRIGQVSAGDWQDPTDTDDYMWVDSDMAGEKGSFVCTIDGDSMFEWLWPGDICIWKKCEFMPPSGLVVVARDDDGKLTTKQLVKRGSKLWLVPRNQDKYKPQELRSDPIGFLIGLERHQGSEVFKRFNPHGLRF